MRRLNPYFWMLKTQARANNLRRQKAKALVRRHKAGEKVDPKLLLKAKSLLGLKLRKYKEYKAERSKKAQA